MIYAYLTILAGCLILVATSGIVINWILKFALNKSLAQAAEANVENASEKASRLNIGEIIGKCENVLIFIFLILEAYTAIALVITAKTIVRKEEIEKNSMFFLGGTMINVAYSVLIGFIVRLILVELKFQVAF
jgi:hypothetical protein